MIFLNFKIYSETSGENTFRLCQIIASVNQKLGRALIIPCLPATEIYKIKTQLPALEIWAQHADPVESGKHTGKISPYLLKQAGASGTLLNHAENPLSPEMLSQSIILCQRSGLETLVSAGSLKDLETLNPQPISFVLFEDPLLISGPIPMIEAHGLEIAEAVKVSKHPLIVGGGIRTGIHVKKSLEIKAAGVVLASEFAMSSDPQVTLDDLVSGFNL